jgi:thioredoxin domain-containing protein 5
MGIHSYRIRCRSNVVTQCHFYVYSTTVLTLAGRYIAGKEIEKFSKGDRSLEALEKFLDEKAGPPPSSHHSSPLSDIDDEPSIKTTFNPDGKVFALEPTTFWERVSREPTFVKFYAPWCHHCQKLAPTWVELAAALTGVVNVAEVNCDAAGAFCRNQEVEGFPVLKLCVSLLPHAPLGWTLVLIDSRSYHNGQRVDYTGEKSVEAMTGFVKKAIAPGVVAVTAEDFQSKIDAEDVFYLLIYKKTDMTSLKLVKEASKVLLGTPRIYSSSDSQLLTRLGLSADLDAGVLVAVKEGEGNAVKYLASDASSTGLKKKADIETWLLKNKFPRVAQLTTDNFISIMKNPTQPLVLLAALSSEDGTLQGNIVSLKSAAKNWEQKEGSDKWARGAVFVWMDGDKWGSWLKSQYGIKKARLPSVVVADHQVRTSCIHRIHRSKEMCGWVDNQLCRN